MFGFFKKKEPSKELVKENLELMIRNTELQIEVTRLKRVLELTKYNG